MSEITEKTAISTVRTPRKRSALCRPRANHASRRPSAMRSIAKPNGHIADYLERPGSLSADRAEVDENGAFGAAVLVITDLIASMAECSTGPNSWATSFCATNAYQSPATVPMANVGSQGTIRTFGLRNAIQHQSKRTATSQ